VIATGDVPAPLADAAGLTGGEALPVAELRRMLPALLADLGPRAARPTLEARSIDGWRALETSDGQVAWIGRALGAIPEVDAQGAAFAAADPSDLSSLWERARLERGERDGRGAQNRAAPTVLTPLRALLVLETDADYARFGLAAPEATFGHDATLGHDAQGALGTRSREGLMGLRGPRDNADADPRLAGRLAEEAARNAGILDVLKQSARAADTPPGIIDGLVGNQVGESYGVGGLGLAGTGAGAGGTAEGTIGLGNLGTIGKGGGAVGVNGSGYGRGAGGLGGRRASAPDVVPGEATVRGSPDKEIIRRIVRRHLNEAKYCYEQALPAKPGLGGRITVQFSIADGHVASSVLQSSTMGDSQVEGCVVQAVHRWEFPRPHEGGIVLVSYPFVFTPARAGSGSPEPVAPVPEAPDRAAREAPDRPAREALAALAGREQLARRVERVAELVGIERTDDAETAAWLIDRREASLAQVTLVAHLLVAAHRTHDAIRVLTERAALDPTPVATELRRIGAEPAAAEVLALARR